jgi:hypothetical protein
MRRKVTIFNPLKAEKYGIVIILSQVLSDTRPFPTNIKDITQVSLTCGTTYVTVSSLFNLVVSARVVQVFSSLWPRINECPLELKCQEKPSGTVFEN